MEIVRLSKVTLASAIYKFEQPFSQNDLL